MWQRAIDLVEEIYLVTDHFPKSEQFDLTRQMRRAAVSIPSNIAEGRHRKTRKDFAQFLHIAYGSGTELETQIVIAKRLSVTKNLDYKRVDGLLTEVMKMLNALISKVSKKLEPKT